VSSVILVMMLVMLVLPVILIDMVEVLGIVIDAILMVMLVMLVMLVVWVNLVANLGETLMEMFEKVGLLVVPMKIKLGLWAEEVRLNLHPL